MAKKNFEAMIEEANESLQNSETRIDAYYEAADQAAMFDKKRDLRLSDIFENDKLSNIYPINQETLLKIIESMSKKYDVAEPVTVWFNPLANRYETIDGHTRIKAARQIGLKTIPCVIKPFTTIEEAVEYAHHRQRDRRNLTPEELLYYANEKRDVKYGDGRDSEIKAKELGVSRRTIDRLKYIANNADKSQIEAFKQSEIGAAGLVEEIKNKKYIEDNADEIEKDMIKAGVIDEKEFVKQKKKEQKQKKEQAEDDKKHDALSEGNAGQPAGLSSFTHSDGHERPVVPVAQGTDAEARAVEEKRESYLLGKEDGIKEGMDKCGKGAEKLFYFALAMQLDGKTPEEIYSAVSDFSPSVIAGFELSEEHSKILEEKLGVSF